jgi:hypothetical protein
MMIHPQIIALQSSDRERVLPRPERSLDPEEADAADDA